MDKVKTFTSTGTKLLYHHRYLQEWRLGGQLLPISLQVGPTSRCNLKCVFCSNVNREQHEDLNIDVLMSVIGKLKKWAKTIEWTGGGDPTMYPDINEAIERASFLGLKQGFITNGVALKANITQENLDRLYWVRVSLNSLDYVDELDLPKIKGTLGFSYVMNEKTREGTKKKLDECVSRYNPDYVRVVPNCQATDVEQDRNNRMYSAEIANWGHPYFYQAKNFKQPENCWWCYLKPFILHDGWVYPCSSVVLNLDADRHFNKKYRWCQMTDLPKEYEKQAQPLPTGNCSHCVFTEQNDLLDSYIHPNGMEDFI